MEEINWLQLRKLLIGKELAHECCQSSYALGCESGREYEKEYGQWRSIADGLAEVLKMVTMSEQMEKEGHDYLNCSSASCSLSREILAKYEAIKKGGE